MSRSPTAPESLAAHTSYKGEDVLEQLRTDFLGKCYLCERKLSGSLQVEHLKPRSGMFAHLAYDWSNLYPSDSCNQCRKVWASGLRIQADTAYPAGGLLDPTDSESSVMERLVQRVAEASLPPVSANELRFEFTPRRADDAPAANTALELDAIHHSPRPNGRTLRSEIYDYWARVLHYLHLCRKDDAAKGREAANALRVLVRKDQPFYAVIRGTLEQLDPHIVQELDL